MALKDKWVDKVDRVDIASAEDINQVANAVIELENEVESGGGKGEDGFSPIISVEKIDGGNRVVITDAKGDNTFDVMDGADGQDGQDGVDGKDGTSVTVESVNESTEDGGSNVVKFSDGKTVTIKNGSKGSTGATGAAGADGKDYVLTEVDKTEIAEEAAALVDTSGFVAKNQGAANVGKILVVGTDGNLMLVDMPEGGASGDVTGTLDGSYNILLSGNIPVGTYTLSFVNEDGTYSGAGTLEVVEVEPDTPSYTNLAVPDADATGEAAWNSGGWCNNSYMAGSSYAYRSATDGRLTTNTIAVEYGDTIYVKGIDYASATYPQVAVFDASGTKLLHGYAQYVYDNGYINELSASTGSDYWSFTLTSASGDRGVRFVRFAGYPSGDISDIIITRNQPIV